MTPIVVGTRASLLAQAQTQEIIGLLTSLFPGQEFLPRQIRTRGDELAEAPLPQIGGKGLFIKELEVALLKGEIDLAVHSFKDLPTELAPGLKIAAITPRVDARDVLVSCQGLPLIVLPPGARLGTSSPRRAAQIRAWRPDIDVVNLRGNLDTRLGKIERGVVEAGVLAAAGLIRLGLADRITEYLPPHICLPAVGQGALAVEIREGDRNIEEMVSALDHLPTRQAITAERVFLKCLGGGCHTPIAAYAEVKDSLLELNGMVASPSGNRLLRAGDTGQAEAPEELGQRVAERLLSMGAEEILAEATQ